MLEAPGKRLIHLRHVSMFDLNQLRCFVTVAEELHFGRAAARLNMSKDETEALVKHYLGFPYPQTGPDARPVPPVLFCIAKDSRDHSPEAYREIVVPMFARLNSAPKVRVTRWGAGVHTYQKAEPGLPLGIAAPVVGFYVNAIQEGYFLK